MDKWFEILQMWINGGQKALVDKLWIIFLRRGKMDKLWTNFRGRGICPQFVQHYNCGVTLLLSLMFFSATNTATSAEDHTTDPLSISTPAQGRKSGRDTCYLSYRNINTLTKVMICV